VSIFLHITKYRFYGKKKKLKDILIHFYFLSDFFKKKKKKYKTHLNSGWPTTLGAFGHPGIFTTFQFLYFFGKNEYKKIKRN
jgi:hypothetical protein